MGKWKPSERRINENGEVEKKCNECGKWKVENNENFAYRNKAKGKFGSQCKMCMNEYKKQHGKQYYQDNKEEIDKKNKQWKQNHKKEWRGYIKQYRRNHNK